MTARPRSARSSSERPSAGRNSSASLRKALLLLSVVARHGVHGPWLTLGELSDQAGVNKSTVLRLVAPLIEENLLERDAETGRFRLGFGCLQLGQAYLREIDLRTVARPELRQLTRTTQFTCHLVVRSGTNVVYVDKVENESTVRMASRIGASVPAYCTAVGKALLAHSPEDVVAAVLAEPLTPVTPRTITDPDDLRRELRTIRRRGYSIDDRENEPEVRCVAAPIFGVDERVVGALSVSALASRMTPSKVREIGPLAVQAAQRVSGRMGSITGGQGSPEPNGPAR
ncbi:MAG: IclR family transcriptional regulator [Micropruina sp.]|uniref:IclR family transcriptional regulator n=1 Tax=Micropruina sp. TaxID=2737536 RepID=UPI0039E2E7B7